MQPVALKIKVSDSKTPLDPMSRLNLLATYTMELGGNVRARVFGRIQDDTALIRQFRTVQSAPQAGSPRAGPSVASAAASLRGVQLQVIQRSQASQLASITSPRLLTEHQVKEKIERLERLAEERKLQIPKFTQEHIRTFVRSPE